jgi:hypothetical protein
MKHGFLSKTFIPAESRVFSSRPFCFLSHFENRFLGSVHRVQAFLIKGLVGDNTSVSILFIGDENLAYHFAYTVCSRVQSVAYLEKTFSFQVNPSHLPDVKIIAVQGKSPFANRFAKHGYIRLPYLRFSLDLLRPTCQIINDCSRRRRRDIKKLSSLNYSCAIYRESEEEFDFYYWTMYLPFMRKRFGKAACVMSYSESKALYRRNGGLVLVYKAKKPAAGILFQTRGRTLYAITIGVYNGDSNLVKNLAGQQALFFLIEWAKRKDFTRLDYGPTAPFLKDNVLQYKKEWGMFAEECPGTPYCLLKLDLRNDAALSFLRHNPLVCHREGRMQGVASLDHRPTNAELQHVFSLHFFPKLDSLIVIVSDGPSARSPITGFITMVTSGLYFFRNSTGTIFWRARARARIDFDHIF